MRRLRSAAGYTLVELVAVCALLSVVLTGVISVLVGGSHAELQLNRRFSAQTAARTAMSVFRNDAHIACAGVVNGGKTQVTLSIPTVNTSTSPATAPTPTSQCGTTTAGANLAKVIWCVLTSPTNATRFALYRSTSGTCTTSSKYQADDLVNNLPGFNGFFAMATTIPQGQLATVTIDIPVNLTGGSTAGKPYDLNETFALRNTVWPTSPATSCSAAAPCTYGLCTVVGGCTVPTIS